MPKRLSIEIVRHSQDDIRVVANVNGKRYRGCFSNDDMVLMTLRGLVRESDIFENLKEIGG